MGPPLNFRPAETFRVFCKVRSAKGLSSRASLLSDAQRARTAEETNDNKNAHDFQNNAFVRSLMLFTGSP